MHSKKQNKEGVKFMAKNYPPYMNSTGAISKILDKLKDAATPDRLTQDYLATELGFSGGSARAFIPLAKKLGLIGSDGTPTDLYKQFRNTNSNTSKAAIAKAMKTAYSDMYSRNEYVHSLEKNDLEGLVMEMTGLEKGHPTIRAVVGSFEALKTYADFNAKKAAPATEVDIPNIIPPSQNGNSDGGDDDLKLNLSYTINLVLPKTDDIAVFSAIFKSLREHLLKK
jgi:hypothetical protein